MGVGEEGNWELGVGGWGRRELGIGSWGLGKKGVGGWGRRELGVGEEEDGGMGRWGELGVCEEEIEKLGNY
uniref:Uncharacterized protein n=1 Tax=Desertifilum tharense IPPAS B-1220 TaxID=1781255 RepID=A0ACD5GQD2_9CYAN